VKEMIEPLRIFHLSKIKNQKFDLII
jgi:hypothetical protein